MKNKRELVQLVIPLALFFLAQRYLNDEVAIACAAVVTALLQLLWRPIAATLLILPIAAVISIANATKYRYTGETLIWQDLAYALPNLGDNVGTLLQYLDAPVILGLGIWVGAFLLAVYIEHQRLPHTRTKGAIFASFILLAFSPTILAAIDTTLVDAPTHNDLNAWTFSELKSTSAVARFVRSTRIDRAELVYAPVGATAFEARAAAIRPAAPSPRRSPDVIAILQESQFDPRQLAACTSRNDCGLEMIEPGMGSRQFGPLHVHVFGGGTWNSELALMTGVPHDWYSEQHYAPYTVAPRIRHGLGHHFRSLGYRTAVVYPVRKGMMNAHNAYRAYGMEEFLDSEALGLSNNWCDVTDDVMYAKLAEVRKRLLYDNDQPLFLVMVTIHNHGPHGNHCAVQENSASFGDSTEQQLSKKVEDYLQRSRAADQASRAFREIVLTSNRPSLILVFGDHQPSFEGMADKVPRMPHRPMSDHAALYFSNYQFFSNFGTESPPISAELDITFLPSTLLELAELPLGSVFDSNMRLRKICNGRLDLCPGGDFLDSYRNHLIAKGFYQ